MKLRPLHDRLLVEPVEEAVRPLSVAPGDRVLFARFAGSEFRLDGEQHLIIREDDVLAILQ